MVKSSAKFRKRSLVLQRVVTLSFGFAIFSKCATHRMMWECPLTSIVVVIFVFWNLLGFFWDFFLEKKGAFLNSTRLRSGIIGALATMESMLLKHGRLFTENATLEFRRAYIIYRSSLNSLADFSLSSGRLRYHIRPKCHMLGHIAFHFLPKNPRYFACYSDEDLIGRMKRVAQVAHPLYMSRLVMQRYIIQICQLWAGHGV